MAILRKTTFRQNRFFDFAVTQKRIIVNTFFSPNVYIMVIFLQLNFQNILTIFKLLIDN